MHNVWREGGRLPAVMKQHEWNTPCSAADLRTLHAVSNNTNPCSEHTPQLNLTPRFLSRLGKLAATIAGMIYLFSVSFLTPEFVHFPKIQTNEETGRVSEKSCSLVEGQLRTNRTCSSIQSFCMDAEHRRQQRLPLNLNKTHKPDG